MSNANNDYAKLIGMQMTPVQMVDTITALRAEAGRIRTQLDEAIYRIKDMLEDDDGQAWKEASKFLLRIKGHDHES